MSRYRNYGISKDANCFLSKGKKLKVVTLLILFLMYDYDQHKRTRHYLYTGTNV